MLFQNLTSNMKKVSFLDHLSVNSLSITYNVLNTRVSIKIDGKKRQAVISVNHSFYTGQVYCISTGY